jgi:exosortase A-associated hydrolase 2
VTVAITRVSTFFPAGDRRLYGALYLPDAANARSRGVVVCPPFADEAIHAHGVLAEVSRRLAGAGATTLLFDYTGTGDSEGGFHEGSLHRYEADIQAAAAWLGRRALLGECGLLGLRLGANLAVRAAAAVPSLSPIALWAPIADLRQYFRTFLRLRVFTEMTTFGRPATTLRGLEARLQAGEPVDVHGYLVSPTMAREFLDGDDSPRALHGRPGLVIELVWPKAPATPPATRAIIAGEPGVSVRRLVGRPFWESARMVSADALLEATLDWLEPGRPGPDRGPGMTAAAGRPATGGRNEPGGA